MGVVVLWGSLHSDTEKPVEDEERKTEKEGEGAFFEYRKNAVEAQTQGLIERYSILSLLCQCGVARRGIAVGLATGSLE